MTTVRRTLFYRFLGFCSYLQYSLLQPSLLAHRTGTLVCPEFPYFIFNRANIEYRVHLITFGFFYFVYRLFYLEAMTAAFVLFYLVHWCNTYVRRSTEFDSKKKKKQRTQIDIICLSIWLLYWPRPGRRKSRHRMQSEAKSRYSFIEQQLRAAKTIIPMTKFHQCHKCSPIFFPISLTE